MKGVKKIVAAVIAAASIGAIGVTASAAETVEPLPAKWMAVYQHGAPSSVNKTYYVTVEGRTRGYKVDCTYFYGGNGSVITVTTQSGYSFKFTKTGTYDGKISGSTIPITIATSAIGSSANTNGGGTIYEAV